MSEAAASGVRAAYSQSGTAWQRGPELVYGPLAEELVARSPVPMAGRVVVDVGAGTGTASRVLAVAGALPIAVDIALGMLIVEQASRPIAIVGDATALPLATASVDGAVAAFSLNHLSDPVAGLRECARVTRPGGPVLASAYAEDDRHPAKEAAETAAREHGWSPAPWYADVRQNAMPQLASVERAAAVCARAGVTAEVRSVRVPFPHLGHDELLAWRFGMAQLAPFVAALPADAREAMHKHARQLLAPCRQPLVRSIIVIAAVC